MGTNMKVVAVIFMAVFTASRTQKCSEDQSLKLLVPHEDCDKFYMCVHGNPVEFVCPPGLSFDFEYQLCNWESLVDCGDRNRPGQGIEPEEDSEEEDSELECEELESEQEPEDEGSEVKPEEEEPDVDTEDAEPEHSFEEENPEQDSEEQKPEEDTEQDSEEDRPEQDSEEEEPELESVEDKPDQRSEEESEENPDEEVPELETEEDEPEQNLEEEEEQELEQESEEGSELDMEFFENGCPIDPSFIWFVPNEKNCNAFYLCAGEDLVPKKCSGNLHFNPISQVCKYPEDAGCEVKADEDKEKPKRPHSKRRIKVEVVVSLDALMNLS